MWWCSAENSIHLTPTIAPQQHKHILEVCVYVYIYIFMGYCMYVCEYVRLFSTLTTFK